MKKTVKINLSGIIFHLDEDAYEKLSAYLEKIHRHFRETKEGAEIISDIELRMTELFQSKLSGLGTSSPYYDFKVLFEKLSDDYRIVVVERAGYGWSEITSADKDLKTLLKETRKFLFFLKIDNCQCGVIGDFIPPFIKIKGFYGT